MPLFITNTSKTAYPVMGRTASNWAKKFYVVGKKSQKY